MDIRVLASGSSGNCYVVGDGHSKLMLEAGISWEQVQRELNFETHTLSGLLCSHSHLDHAGHIKSAIKAGIDVYGLQSTFDALSLSGHRLKPIEALRSFQIGSWAVLPFNTEHDIDSVGYLLASKSGEKLAYITDSFYSRFKFVGVTHWMLEINYDTETIKQNVADGVIDREHYKRVIRSHCSLETAVELLKANDLSKTIGIIAIHLSQENSNEQHIKTTLQRAFGKPVYIAG